MCQIHVGYYNLDIFVHIQKLIHLPSFSHFPSPRPAYILSRPCKTYARRELKPT
jgi:hypothetical protein